MQLIETKTLGTAQSSIVFSDIPQTFTDLYVLISGRTARSLVVDGVGVGFNGDTTGANYSGRRLFGDGSSPGSDTTYAGMPWFTGANATANTFGNAALYIPNYTSSTAKSFSIDGVSENNATQSYQGIGAGRWTGTAAITTLTINSEVGNNLQAGSTISLYGIRATVSSPKATGGIVSLIGGYYVHTFTSSGTFTPLQNLTCDYLVVAGGGGGGAGSAGKGGGGGGAGGFRTSAGTSGGGGAAESALNLTANSAYTVTIGAGGNGGTSGGRGSTGSDSVFSTITSAGGGAGGGNSSPVGGTGGSGGGGASNTGTGAGAGTTNQGYAGGTSANSGNFYGGGGGGAGATGTAGPTSVPTGGNGVISTITGASTYYGGGGGGGAPSASGGLGGGGNGSQTTATAGASNTGGGGGASNQTGQAAAAGGSGIVIVRYAA